MFKRTILINLFFSALLLGLLWWDTNAEKQIEGQADSETQRHRESSQMRPQLKELRPKANSLPRQSLQYVYLYLLYLLHPYILPTLYYIYYMYSCLTFVCFALRIPFACFVLVFLWGCIISWKGVIFDPLKCTPGKGNQAAKQFDLQQLKKV